MFPILDGRILRFSFLKIIWILCKKCKTFKGIIYDQGLGHYTPCNLVRLLLSDAATLV